MEPDPGSSGGAGDRAGPGSQSQFREWLEEVRLWDGSPLPASLRSRLEREFERLECLEEQIRLLEQRRRDQVAEAKSREEKQVVQLLLLRGIGMNSGWLFVMEFFAWRQFRNRRQVGAWPVRLGPDALQQWRRCGPRARDQQGGQ